MIETERLLLRPWEVADNAKPRRVLDKLGFSYVRTDPAVPCEVAGDRCDQVVMRLDVASAELS